MNTLESMVLDCAMAAADFESVALSLLSRLREEGGFIDATLSLDGDSDQAGSHPLPGLRGITLRPGGDRPSPARMGEAVRAPLALGGRILGHLTLIPPDTAAARQRALALAPPLARHCALLAQRHAIRAWTAARLGRPWLMAGMSPGVQALDTFIERAAPSPLPVLLRGDYGTETALVAAALHARAPWHAGPLVPVDGNDPEGAPAQWLARAAGGTLVLHDVDALPATWQARLARHLGTLPPLGLDGVTTAGTPPAARVVATTTADLEERLRQGRFSRPLWDWLSCLMATVPPLKERRGDMRALLGAALDRHGHRPEERLGEDLVAACEAHTWPENWLELDRVVARLAVLAAGPRIGRRDLALHTPALAALLPPEAAPLFHTPAPSEQPGPASLRHEGREDGNADDEPTTGDPDRWVAVALAPEAGVLDGLHPGLRRALTYLGGRYAEPVQLPQVARHAYVSPSHLRLLFRRDLGLSCKALLTRIRVRQAQALLRDNPRLPVTEVALQAGFGDLSHFERSFRRLVGQSPGQYRRTA